MTDRLPWVAQVHAANPDALDESGNPCPQPPRISFLMIHKLTYTHQRAHIGLEMPSDATPEAIELARRCALDALNCVCPHPDQAIAASGVQLWSGRDRMRYRPIMTPTEARP